MTLSHILFPIDFSERSHGAAPHVEAWAIHFGAKVTLLHVISHGEIAKFVFANDPMARVLRGQLREKMDTFAAEFLPGVGAEKLLLEGEPGQTISRFAHEQDVDLIMMPSHGYGPFRSLLLGSVTAKVLHDAACPVWTGAHVDTPPDRRCLLPCRSILCAVDLGPRTAALMQRAADLARDLEATLRFIHATPGEDQWVDLQSRAVPPRLQNTAHARIHGFMREAGVEAPICVCPGNVAAVVREEAIRHGAELVLIGRGLAKAGAGRLRAHTYRIVRDSPCPVISI